MKNLIAVLLFALLISLTSYSQTTNRKYEYAIVILQGSPDQIIINYGNNRSENFSELKKIKSGKIMSETINYLIDAFNYLDEQGYELVSTYNESSVGRSFENHYVFKREIKK
ncbi:MAG TPA: hypothetical protein VKC90_15345 [Chitinophagaceae bacterium]|nr:hypothetical protein [Chitinophagaceae bacterium]